MPITPEDWRRAVCTDPELEFPDRGRKRVLWVDQVGDERGRMLLHNGRVVAKNPGQDLIAKMIILARLLGARVQGDDGEVYS
jgi:hypothetical protein